VRVGNRYTIRGELQATGFFAELFSGNIEQTIQGEIVGRHLRPTLATSKIGTGRFEELSVDWASNQASFTNKGGKRSEALEANSTDVMSFIFSFAVAPPADSLTQFSILTTRGQNQYRYEYLGVEALSTALGEKRTHHIAVYALNKKRNPEATRYDAWLSEADNMAPIKLKFPVANGRALFELTATSVKTVG
jgi:hypothetical protein